MYNKSGRGYTQGRIRAKNILYFEAEYRIRLMKNDLIGMVIFVNGTAAADPDTGQFSQVNPAGGIGGRVKINRKSETNLSVDIGFGERESLCFYIGVQEAF
jgi:hemolysin activation/secretion protein